MLISLKSDSQLMCTFANYLWSYISSPAYVYAYYVYVCMYMYYAFMCMYV